MTFQNITVSQANYWLTMHSYATRFGQARVILANKKLLQEDVEDAGLWAMPWHGKIGQEKTKLLPAAVTSNSSVTSTVSCSSNSLYFNNKGWSAISKKIYRTKTLRLCRWLGWDCLCFKENI